MVERVTGFSGMDIDGTIKKLMQAQRVPLDKLNQKKQVLEWQQTDYRTINSKVLELKNKAFDMKLQGPYAAKLGSSSNEGILSAKPSTSAVDGNYTLEVKKVATAASTNSSGTVGAKAKTGLATELKDLGLDQNETMTITGTKGSATITIDKTQSVATLIANFNSQSSRTGVRINYDENMDKFFVTSTSTGDKQKIDIKVSGNSTSNLLDDVMKLGSGATKQVKLSTSDSSLRDFSSDGTSTVIDNSLAAEKKIKLTYNGTTSEIAINKDTTLAQVITSINSSDVGKLGVTAYLDKDNKLVIMNPDTTVDAGATPPKDGTLTFGDADSTGLWSKLGISAASDSAVTETTYQQVAVQNGVNAEVVFGSGSSEVTSEYESNTFTFNGIQFTAKTASPGTKVTVTVSQDTDTIYNNIKSLIDKYNETIDVINGKLSEERYRTYTPLTDDQREALSDTQEEQWEAKAKSGLLKNDFLLSSVVNRFRLSMVNSVGGLSTGDLNQLSQIGISTSSDYTQKGKLVINEANLRKAITENPEQVMNLFIANDGVDGDSGDGLALRLYNIADNAISSIRTKAGTSVSGLKDYDIGKTIYDLNKKIDSMEDRLTAMEDRYYKQFSAMEAAMQKYNSQSSYFSSMFGGQ